MVEEKRWYQSTTIWGSLISVAAALTAGFGIVIDAATQADIATAIVQIVGGAGALVAIYGRLRATHVLS